MSENGNYEPGQQETAREESNPLETDRHGTAPAEIPSPGSLYRIGEVSRLTATKPFVLRYWETEFPMLQPVKSPKGHRLYRREDIDTVLQIKRLLYDEGFTIAGARRHLREGDSGATPGDETRAGDAVSPAEASGSETRREPAAHLGERRLSTEHTQTLAGGRFTAEAPVVIDRKVLLDLRDALRSFLTLLESE